MINACRWLEFLPNAASLRGIGDADIEGICEAARSKAVELAIVRPAHCRRAQTHWHRNAERFARLISLIEKSFGGPIAGDRLGDDLSKAIGFRNRCAHGFLPASEAEQRAFLRSTLAMEASAS